MKAFAKRVGVLLILWAIYFAGFYDGRYSAKKTNVAQASGAVWRAFLFTQCPASGGNHPNNCGTGSVGSAITQVGSARNQVVSRPSKLTRYNMDRYNFGSKEQMQSILGVDKLRMKYVDWISFSQKKKAALLSGAELVSGEDGRGDSPDEDGWLTIPCPNIGTGPQKPCLCNLRTGKPEEICLMLGGNAKIHRGARNHCKIHQRKGVCELGAGRLQFTSPFGYGPGGGSS